MADARTEIASGLRDWLRDQGVDAKVEVTGRATGGYSQETWLIRARTGGETRDLVLRLPTLASGPEAIRTQRAALQTVAGSLPAPAIVWYDDGDQNPFARPFIVMERIAGEVPVGWHELDEPARTKLAEQAIDALAAMHRVDPAPLASSGYASRRTELAWFRARLERFEPLPAVMHGAFWWLDRHQPAPIQHQTIVHGDYRMGNMIVAGDRLRGVLDWEMTGIGDPMSDLAWCFIPVWELPLVDEATLIQRYATRIGQSIDEERLHWFRIAGYVRLSYYMFSGRHAFDRGKSDDLRFAALRLQLPTHLDRLAATLAGEPIT